MYFHFQQLSKQVITHLSFHPFSPYSDMQALAASRLVSADFSTLGVLTFKIGQRTRKEIGKNTNTIISFYAYLLLSYSFLLACGFLLRVLNLGCVIL